MASLESRISKVRCRAARIWLFSLAGGVVFAITGCRRPTLPPVDAGALFGSTENDAGRAHAPEAGTSAGDTSQDAADSGETAMGNGDDGAHSGGDGGTQADDEVDPPAPDASAQVVVDAGSDGDLTPSPDNDEICPKTAPSEYSPGACTRPLLKCRYGAHYECTCEVALYMCENK
jgi:hypothetical protein